MGKPNIKQKCKIARKDFLFIRIFIFYLVLNRGQTVDITLNTYIRVIIIKIIYINKSCGKLWTIILGVPFVSDMERNVGESFEFRWF